MILRFRDLSTEVGETIRQHKLYSERTGYVWWGWWKKQGETVPVEAFQHLAQQSRKAGGLEIYLFDTGTLNLYRATLADIEWNNLLAYIPSPERHATPDYYGDSRYLAWFKIIKIEEELLSEAFLRTWSYVRIDEFFVSKSSIFIEFYDKRLCRASGEINML